MDPLTAWNLNFGLMTAALLIVVAAVVFSIRRFMRRYNGNDNSPTEERPNPSRED